MYGYFTCNEWALWLVAAVVFMIIELASFSFYITCLAIGALGAMAGALIGFPFWFNAILWAVVSGISIFLVRPILTKHLQKHPHKRESNTDALIGKQGVVTEEIKQGGYGYVKIDGDEWRSVTADGAAVKKGTRVEVAARESIILTVKPV